MDELNKLSAEPPRETQEQLENPEQPPVPALKPPVPHRYAIPLFLMLVSILVLGAEMVSGRLHDQVAGSVTRSSKAPVSAQMPSFSLRDQDNNVVKERQLLGHVWVADFIFTQCDDACIVLNRHVIAMQHVPALKGLRFVSFSADSSDGPAALKRYLQQRFSEGDQSRWRLLAADTEQYSQLAVTMGFAERVEDIHNGFIVISPSFYLIDRQGYVCGTYDGLDDNDVARLRTDAANLLKKSS